MTDCSSSCAVPVVLDASVADIRRAACGALSQAMALTTKDWGEVMDFGEARGWEIDESGPLIAIRPSGGVQLFDYTGPIDDKTCVKYPPKWLRAPFMEQGDFGAAVVFARFDGRFDDHFKVVALWAHNAEMIMFLDVMFNTLTLSKPSDTPGPAHYHGPAFTCACHWPEGSADLRAVFDAYFAIV